MARLGLGPEWHCLLANDIDSQKCAAYRANFGDDDLVEGPIEELLPTQLPHEPVDLVWASFPCQDLSLAGGRNGFAGARSSVFFPFWSHIENLIRGDAAPRIIAIENVAGLLTSNGGADFSRLVSLIAQAGYKVSAMMLDAKHFTPQSRPRIFIFGFSPDAAPMDISNAPPIDEFTPSMLHRAVDAQPPDIRDQWVWLAPRPQSGRNTDLTDIIDWDASSWHSPSQTERLISMMNKRHRGIIDAQQAHGGRRAGAAFRRTRQEDGRPVQRVEARFDGLAGCLRTPAGGSSRQIVIAVEDGNVRTRLMTPLEAARLMGLPESYDLPSGATAALKLCGDGVCVPVVQWIAENIVEPALAKQQRQRKVA